MSDEKSTPPEGGGVTGSPPTNWLGPKPWDQISTEEKLERLRYELDGWRRECARLRGLVELLEHHAHGADGAVQVGLREAENFFRMSSAVASLNTLR